MSKATRSPAPVVVIVCPPLVPLAVCRLRVAQERSTTAVCVSCDSSWNGLAPSVDGVVSISQRGGWYVLYGWGRWC